MNTWKKIIEYAKHYPSPHNTQPWKIKIISDSQADIYYDPNRLLPDTDQSGMFMRVGLGIFIECLDIVAKNYSKNISYDKNEVEQFKFKSDKLEKICTIFLKDYSGVAEFDVDILQKRRTARSDYNDKNIEEKILEKLKERVSKYNSKLLVSNNPELISWLIKINRDTVFEDMYDGRTRQEIGLWARYGKKHSYEKKDGLSSLNMGFSAITMWSFFKLAWLFKLPILKQYVYRLYLNKTKITKHMGWLESNMKTYTDHIDAGHMLAQFWFEATKHNIYIHPFGSLITNIKAKEKLSRKLKTENPENLWLILRIGYSKQPLKSLRLNTEEIII